MTTKELLDKYDKVTKEANKERGICVEHRISYAFLWCRQCRKY